MIICFQCNLIEFYISEIKIVNENTEKKETHNNKKWYDRQKNHNYVRI